MGNFQLHFNRSNSSPFSGLLLSNSAASRFILFVFLLAASAIIGLLIALKGLNIGIVLLVLFVGLPAAIFSIINLQFGAMLVFFISFFLSIGLKINEELPLGLFLDIYILVLFSGFLVRSIIARNWTFLNNAPTYVLGVWIVFNILQVFNPMSASSLLWTLAIRSLLSSTLFYFVCLSLADDWQFVKNILKVILGLSFLAAIYGIFQELNGFLPFEMNYLLATPNRMKLIFVMGRYRIFSFLTDPMAFGILMGYMTLFCFVLLVAPISARRKILLSIMSVCCILGMLYSGTRAAYVLLPAGLLFMAVMIMNFKIITVAGFLFLIGLFVVNMPTSNKTIYRFQTAFKPEKDASYLVRKHNQTMIKPIIHGNPFGVGLNSVGAAARKYAPHSWLANFPPDSSYVKVAIETGWVGLFIYITIFVTFLITGINNHFKLKDIRLQYLSYAILSVIFVMAIANYPQEAVTSLPNVTIFYCFAAILCRLPDLDKKLNLNAEPDAHTTSNTLRKW
jgi:hypothetical protein